MASLKDIARATNTSPALVSKVLSGRLGTTGCGPQTRRAIQAKARQLHYHPNPLAVALRKGRKAAVGVFLHPIGEDGSALMERLLAGITTVLNARDQQLWLGWYQTNAEFLARCHPRARQRVDGLIVAGLRHPRLTAVLRRFVQHGLPVVTVLEEALGAGIPNVSSDRVQQGWLATHHLIERGCRRIGHVSQFASRQQGYQQALAAHGLAFDERLVFAAPDFKLEAGVAAVRHWRRQHIAVDGIVAQSDHQAIGAIRELQAGGSAVPDDVRVVGIDDSPLCQVCPVPLSSVSQEMQALGQVAAELLLRRIDGEPVASVVVPPRLCRRASS